MGVQQVVTNDRHPQGDGVRKSAPNGGKEQQMADEQKVPGEIKLPPVAGLDTDLSSVKTLSAAQIDLETSRVRLMAEKVKVQKEALELEKLLADVEELRNRNSNRIMASETNTDALNQGIEERRQHEEGCTHKKGGSSEDLLHGAISKGIDSSNYAVITHTLSNGVKFRLCQRCGRTWFPKDPDYNEAMSWPTKNSPSDSCIVVGVSKNLKGAPPRLTSEIPHSGRNAGSGPQMGPAGY